jgi:hypothetical protein
MPAMLQDARLKEKFQDEEYVSQVEQMFRDKFIENLGVSYHQTDAIMIKSRAMPLIVGFKDQIYFSFVVVAFWIIDWKTISGLLRLINY